MTIIVVFCFAIVSLMFKRKNFIKIDVATMEKTNANFTFIKIVALVGDKVKSSFLAIISHKIRWVLYYP